MIKEDTAETGGVVRSHDVVLKEPKELQDYTVLDTEGLREESRKILAQLISEDDQTKAKDLTYLFNQNQNKKTAVRVNKLNDLLDVIADQAMVRFLTHPDEISNKELLDSLKVIQDLILNGQKQVSEPLETPAPLIQFNQQNNEVNIEGKLQTSLSRESRDKVKLAVEALLKGLGPSGPTQILESDEIIVDEEINEEALNEHPAN